MAEIKRFQRQTTFERPRIDMTEAQGLQSLASKLQQFSNRQQTVMDRQAALEGERAGQAAASGKVGGVDLKQEQTIRAHAFNKGAQMAHAAAIQTDIRANVGRIELEHKSDPAGFEAALGGYRDGLFGEIDPMLRPHAESEIADYASRAQLRILEQHQANQIKENAAQTSTMVNGIRDDAMNAYRAGDIALALKKQEQLFALWDEAVADGVFDVEKVATAKERFAETADGNLLLGQFDKTLRNQGIEGAEKALDNLRRVTKSDLSPEARDKLVSTMETRLTRARATENRKQARLNAEQAAIEKQHKGAVKSAIHALDRGYIPENLEQLTEIVEGTGLEAELKKASQFAEAANKFSLLDPATQEATLKKLKEDKSRSGEEVELIERYQKVHNHTTKMLKENPLQLAVEQGVVTGLPPIDLNNPETLRQRMMAVQTAEAHYRQNISPLTKREAAQMSDAMTKMGADQKLAVLGAVVSATGDNSLEIMGQLDKNNQTLLAMAGSLMAEGQPEVARLAILGSEQILHNKGILPKDADLMPEVNSYLGTAFIANPRYQAAVVRTVKSVYAAMAADAGIIDGALDADLLNTALEAVTGGVIMRDNPGWGTGDSYVVAPAHGVDEDQFEEWIDELTIADIEAMGGIMALEGDELVEQVQDGVLVSVGRGRYLVNVGTGYLLAPNGEPFELTWGVVPPIDTVVEEPGAINPAPLPPLGNGESIPLDSGVNLPVEESGPIPLDFGGIPTELDVPEGTGLPITEVPFPDPGDADIGVGMPELLVK